MDKITTPHGTFFISKAYLLGALHSQRSCGKRYQNPFKPGPDLAQYSYGFANELHGYHDAYDLPFEQYQVT